jgi:Putative prokaryotic signal transducing protein
MKRLRRFSLTERPLAALLRQRLEQEGIACLLRNEDLFTALGEIPLLECLPELWVVDDEVYPRARLLLEGWLQEAEQALPPWTCPGCGEGLEGQFDACWKCGRERG